MDLLDVVTILLSIITVITTIVLLYFCEPAVPIQIVSLSFLDEHCTIDEMVSPKIVGAYVRNKAERSFPSMLRIKNATASSSVGGVLNAA